MAYDWSAGEELTAAKLDLTGLPYVAAGGSSNAYTADFTPDLTLAAGLRLAFKANHTNTGAATLNVDGTGVTAIKKNLNQALIAGDIQNGQIVIVVYDGTNFLLLSHTPTAAIALTASDALQSSADTERSNNTTSWSAGYAKKKETRMSFTGTIRVKFDLKTGDASYSAEGQVYINGVATGTLRENTSLTYVTYSEDLSVTVDDLVQLYIRTAATGGAISAYCRNFRIYFDKAVTTDAVVVTN